MEPGAFLPEKGRSRETAIRRDRSGRWFNGADPVEHPNLVKSFDSWVDRAPDGRFCLSNEINWAYIDLEGPAYVVRDLNIVDDRIELILSGDRREWLDASTLAQGTESALWCAVRGGRCPARFDNHATTKLSALIHEDDSGTPYVCIAGARVYPPLVKEPTRIGVEAALDPDFDPAVMKGGPAHE